MSMFEAMYYPYGTIQNYETIKKCLFYLDKLYFLTPDKNTIFKRDNNTEVNNLYDVVKECTNERIIEPIHPSEVLLKHENSFIERIKEDLNDYKFTDMIEQNFSGLQYCNSSYCSSLIRRKTIINKAFNEYVDENYWELYDSKIPFNREQFDEYIVKRDGTDTCSSFTSVKPEFGESILLNHVIYSCFDRKISPLTDDVEHSRMLAYKLKRNYEYYKPFLYEHGYISDLNQQLLTSKVMDKRLYGLENASISDIINFREDHKDELRRFRTEMGKLSTEIKSKLFDIEFESEISQIVKEKIDPSIEELNKSMEEFKDEMITRYVKKIMPVALTFSISAYSVGLEVGILSSVLVNFLQSKMHKDGTELIGTLLDDWRLNRNSKRNSLQYLMSTEKYLISTEKKFNI